MSIYSFLSDSVASESVWDVMPLPSLLPLAVEFTVAVEVMGFDSCGLLVLVPPVVDNPCALSRNVCLAKDNRLPIQPKGAATESAKEEEVEEELLSTPPSTEPEGVAALATVDVGSEEFAAVDSVDDDDDCELLLAVRKFETEVKTDDPADFN